MNNFLFIDQQPICRNGNWTKFFDRDNPSGNGDYETLRDIIRENPRSVCSNSTGVHCRLKNRKINSQISNKLLRLITEDAFVRIVVN